MVGLEKNTKKALLAALATTNSDFTHNHKLRCHDLALLNYHQVMCGKKFDSPHKNAKDSTDSSFNMVLLVFLRFPAIVANLACTLTGDATLFDVA